MAMGVFVYSTVQDRLQVLMLIDEGELRGRWRRL